MCNKYPQPTPHPVSPDPELCRCIYAREDLVPGLLAFHAGVIAHAVRGVVEKHNIPSGDVVYHLRKLVDSMVEANP
jgi:hypothetical protein